MRPSSVQSLHLSRRALALRAISAALAALALRWPAPRTLAQDIEPFSVALDWYPNANHAGLFLAKERGYYAAEGLAPDFYTPSDPTTVLQTVGAGRDAFGVSYQTDILLARAAGVPAVSVLALVQTPLQGIMVLADSGITRPRELVGKTVGYPGIPSQEAFLATMLEDDGATMTDVDLVNIGFDLVPALIAGRVDGSLGAFWTHETILAEQEGYPTTMLKVDDWGVPPYYELVLAASEATVAERPELVERFLRATRRGYEDAIADPDAAIAALQAASPDLDVPVEQAGIALLIPAWTEGGVPFGTQTAARWDAYARWMTDRDLIPDDLDVAAAWRSIGVPVATPVP
jgi:putative hydroxymethylpyrimidine transport system substrate-binding protein